MSFIINHSKTLIPIVSILITFDYGNGRTTGAILKVKIGKIGNRVSNLLFWGNESQMRRFWTFILVIFLTPTVGLTLTFLMLLISPVFKLRVSIIPTNYFGHFVYEIDRLISLNYSLAKRTIFTPQPNISNKFFWRVIKPKFKVWPRLIIIPTFIMINILHLQSQLILTLVKDPKFSESKKLMESKSWFELVLKNVIPNYLHPIREFGYLKPIVSFLLRERSFRDKTRQERKDASTYRDVNPKNYESLVESLSENFQCIRAGKEVLDSRISDKLGASPLHDHSEEREIEDFITVSESKVCVTTDSGSLMLPILFRKRSFLTNLSLYGLINCVPNQIVMLKKYRFVSSSYELNFFELMEMGVHTFTEDCEFTACGIIPIENSSIEIEALKEEIVAYSAGEWAPTPKNQETVHKINNYFFDKRISPVDFVFSNTWIDSNFHLFS